MRDRDKFRGCLIGGAAGDALGYAVEFMREKQIFNRYGEGGIREYELRGGVAEISDDTQMTLFTANGLLLGKARGKSGPVPYDISRCYLDWLTTQEDAFPPHKKPKYAWLANVPALYSRRAPGNTCLAALRQGGEGSTDEPINMSKGCGGVMRVAPVGLYFNDRGRDVREVSRLGAEAAALTHGHPLGWMPGAALAQIVHEVSQDGTALEDAAAHALDTIDEVWPECGHRAFFRNLMEKAVNLAAKVGDDLPAIHQLGEGWVGDEALAIALYCALKYPGDMDKALIASVNHNGDSDSTGAVAGNIVGAQVGLSGIPAKYRERLELYDLIVEVADDLWRDGPEDEDDAVWKQKYVDVTYKTV